MDLLLFIVLAAFVVNLAVPTWVIALLPLCCLGLWGSWRVQKKITHIGCDREGLYLIRNTKKLPIQIKTGSIKRKKMVRLCWSIWPWNALVLRADSFKKNEDFQDFKRNLYGWL